MTASMTSFSGQPVSAVILAGGQGRRFGGEDKGLVMLAGRPLVLWAARRLSSQAAEVLVNANRNLARYGALGHTVVPDCLPGFHGPLVGLLSAARTAQQEWLLTVPCDVPFLPLTLVAGMRALAGASQVPLVRAADETGIHYAIMLAHRDLIPDLESWLREGGRQVRGWQERHPLDTLYCGGDDPYAFLNINTPDALRAAERLASRYADPIDHRGSRP
jgi:molybdopterin-guanine dinucleotide biosynthesis protein A